jgi:hypothetical protein
MQDWKAARIGKAARIRAAEWPNCCSVCVLFLKENFEARFEILDRADSSAGSLTL